MSRRSVSVLLVAILFLHPTVLFSAEKAFSAESAWERLLRENPMAGDDPGLDWKDRLILHALSPAQAEAYYGRGVGAGELTLSSGQTLAEYLDEKLAPGGTLFVVSPTPCRLFSEQVLEERQLRTLWARGGDLSSQRGSASGCQIPVDAVALMLQIKVVSSLGGRVKVWSADSPEPAEAAVEESGAELERTGSLTLVALCRDDCTEGELQIRSSEVAEVGGDVMGYFRPLRAEDQPSSGYSFATESLDNNFFGSSAGSSNTTGSEDSFFGGFAGESNTTGNANSFFGYVVGYLNTSGSFNSFFGARAGESNTTGAENAFFGARAGFSNTTGSFNSFFGRNAGFNNGGSYNAFFGAFSGQLNTTGVNNSFFGTFAGNANTTGSDNSFFGRQSGLLNTTGSWNSFVGVSAGYSNTSGMQNSFAGALAGVLNTTGSGNSFFGKSAGGSNTVENGNTFIGDRADLNPGGDPVASPVVNATVLGSHAYVSQSDSLVLGSIKGVNNATADVRVGIGTTAPQRALHVRRSDGSAGILVEEAAGSTAVRTLFQLVNRGAPRFAIKNSASGTEWSFQQSTPGDFLISLEGTGGSEFSLFRNGRLRIGPGPSVKFDLDPNGNLMITGNLTANGMVYASDRNLKTDFQKVDPQEILRKVAELPITQWRFKEDPPGILHTGPMAQDFYAVFGLGEDDRHISPADISGIALAAIQGQQLQIGAQQEQINAEQQSHLAQQKEIEALRAEVEQLKALLRGLTIDRR